MNPGLPDSGSCAPALYAMLPHSRQNPKISKAKLKKLTLCAGVEALEVAGEESAMATSTRETAWKKKLRNWALPGGFGLGMAKGVSGETISMG